MHISFHADFNNANLTACFYTIWHSLEIYWTHDFDIANAVHPFFELHKSKLMYYLISEQKSGFTAFVSGSDRA